MNKKGICIIFCSIVILIIVIMLVFFTDGIVDVSKDSSESYEDNNISNEIIKDIEYDKDDENTDYVIDTYITLSSNKISIEGSGAEEKDNTITISKAGNYSISGSIEDGQIIIDTDKESIVRILLNNVNINSNNSSPIFIKKVKKCIITLKDETENVVTDTSNYVYENSDEDEPKATIFSKQDLVINGNGSLKVISNYNDAISSKDSIKIFNTNIFIESVDDGIKGKDYVYINNSDISIKSSGDGIKSTNSDSQELDCFVILENTNLNIEALNDGIDAKGSIYINGGKFNIITGGSSTNYSQEKNTRNSFENKNRFNEELSSSNSDTDSSSAKGIKSDTNILITSGQFNIDSSDDSIHSNNIIIIEDGEYEISSGDDGIHADKEITINNGKINIKKSYEGIESAVININDGNIKVVSTDDGINVAGGKDSSSQLGRPGENKFAKTDNNYSLNISGGTIEINAAGDGLDSNGSIYITGGDIKVFGPTDNGNGALDYDQICKISGGNLVAIGSSGMLQAPSNDSEQYSLSYVLDTNYYADSIISIKDSSNNEILNITAQKSYSSVVFSSNDIKQGETYSLYIDNNKVETLTVNNDIVTTNNSKFGGNINSMPRGGNKVNKRN